MLFRNAGFKGLLCDTEILCVSLYRNPELDHRFFDRSMGAVRQVEDVRTSFLTIVDFNGHHREGLGYTSTNCHGVVAFDFGTVEPLTDD